ncbi:Pimeloyl-ACP methyl ester carboxylesterase [Azospirillum oryzae]|uniref:Pimeloyl-ACP methyl ester carboxylesterase n=1 Tax=Azospirillum oryzae TaxID=286727 RepID=A0A1X7DRA4_9PROT|nr:alpha/beta hydrolase [Azospirillum oryzae]SMF20217.1 Pimeloyl-ACP methyl ester carboxylesterase [Azospirillum oryzae]
MSKKIETTGAVIHALDEGRGETALVFLHYWGGSARTWRHVVARLKDRARCVSLDLRGWGGSVALDGRYDLDAMAGDVSEVIAKMGLARCILVGHSMGGKVAQIVAAKGGGALAGLVLIAPSPPTGMPVPAEVREAMLASYQSAGGVNEALKILCHRDLPQEDRLQVVEDTLRGAAGAKREWTTAGMLARLDGISDIRIPTLIAVGDCDRVERADGLREIYGEILPAAEFRILPGVGHLSPLEAPAAVAEACSDLLSAVAAG